MRTARAVLAVVSFFCFTIAVHAQSDIPKDVLRKYPADRYIHRLGTGESAERPLRLPGLRLPNILSPKYPEKRWCTSGLRANHPGGKRWKVI